MKIGRNAPCPCGSGKKYKRCCMGKVQKQTTEIYDDIEQITAMNPNLTIDELNAVVQHKAQEMNSRPNADFCGLSANHMQNWLYAPFKEKEWVNISTPDDILSSPVMRYLEVILDEAMSQGGSFKATAKGNLPVKVVKKAQALLPEFAVSKFTFHYRLNEFTGINEDKFNALHYTRILAELAGIIYHRSGKIHVKKAAQKEYQTHGLKAFFLPMLEATINDYNWAYLDGFDDVDLRTFWVFMLWRLQSHRSVDQLVDEVIVAFPDLVHQFMPDEYCSAEDILDICIESRFVRRFLEFWGFVIIDPHRRFGDEATSRSVELQPLLEQTFRFSV